MIAASNAILRSTRCGFCLIEVAWREAGSDIAAHVARCCSDGPRCFQVDDEGFALLFQLLQRRRLRRFEKLKKLHFNKSPLGLSGNCRDS
jgi:hypothetical protein